MGSQEALQGATVGWLELLVAELLHCYPTLHPASHLVPLMQSCQSDMEGAGLGQAGGEPSPLLLIVDGLIQVGSSMNLSFMRLAPCLDAPMQQYDAGPNWSALKAAGKPLKPSSAKESWQNHSPTSLLHRLIALMMGQARQRLICDTQPCLSCHLVGPAMMQLAALGMSRQGHVSYISHPFQEAACFSQSSEAGIM